MVAATRGAKGKKAVRGQKEQEKEHDKEENVSSTRKKKASKRERKGQDESEEEVTGASEETRRGKRAKIRSQDAEEEENPPTPRTRSTSRSKRNENDDSDGDNEHTPKKKNANRSKNSKGTPQTATRRSTRRAAAVVDLSQEAAFDSDSTITSDDEVKSPKTKRKATKPTKRKVIAEAETPSTQATASDAENTPSKRRSARSHNPTPTYTSPTLKAMSSVSAIDSASKSTKPPRTQRASAKVPKGKQPVKDAESEDLSTGKTDLFNAVKEGSRSFSDLLHSWRLRFSKNPNSGSRELLNFILYSCGATSPGVGDDEDLESLDMEVLVNNIVRDLEDSKELSYPIVSKTKVYRHFKTWFTEFWEAFLIECWDSEAFHTTDIVENCIDWLVTLSSSEVRAVRHTSTVAAYAIGNSLIDRACHIRDEMAPVVRQHAAEEKKIEGTGKKTPKFKKLDEMKTTFDTQMAKTMEAVGLIFKGIILHRYRDIMPEVRIASSEALGSWIVRMPDEYLDDKYLKYLGWLLNDKSAKVRSTVLDSLQNIYDTEDVAKLEVFTSRFLRRYLEMCDDVDDDVVLSAIQLISKLDRLQMLNDECDLSVVERLVFYEEDEEISKAAAEFACLQYDAFGTSQNSLTEKQLTTQAIALIEFAEEYMNSLGELSHPLETLAKAFWDLEDCQVIHNWRLLAKLLGSDSQDPPLSSEQQTILIQLIAAVLKEIKAEEVATMPKSRKTSRKKQTEEVTMAQLLREPTSVYFCKELPHFMMRFQSDSNKVCLLLQWLSLLNWDSANLQQHQKQVELLLQRLKQVYLTYSEEPFLEALSSAFNYMKESNNPALIREVELVLFSIVQESIDQCKSLLEKENDDDSQFALRSWLARLSYLAGYLDLRDYVKLADRTLLVEFLRQKPNSVTKDVTLSLKYALNIVLKDLFWLTTPIFERMQDKEGESNEDISETIEDILLRRESLEDVLLVLLSLHLKQPVTRTSSNVHELFEDEEAYQSDSHWHEVQLLQMSAFNAFCDMRCLYVEKFEEFTPPLNGIAYKPNNNLLVLSQSFYERTIDNEDIDENSRRELLVALASASIWNPQNKRQAAAVLRCVTSSNLRPHAKAFGKLLSSLSPVKLLEVQMIALRHAFEDDPQSALELAKTLSQSLGVKLPATLRGSYLKFLIEGVRGSFLAPVSEHLGFLPLLKPYLYRLDKSSLKVLQTHFEKLRDSVDEDISDMTDVVDEFYSNFNTSASKADNEEAVKYRSITALSDDEEETKEPTPSSITIRPKRGKKNAKSDVRVRTEPVSDDEVFDTPESKVESTEQDAEEAQSIEKAATPSNDNEEDDDDKKIENPVNEDNSDTEDKNEEASAEPSKEEEKDEEVNENRQGANASQGSDDDEVASFRTKRRRTK
ncbi:cohesin subunit [Thraustotheca clavata]|uniref:Cohesin subunit n=1 Tax=Thraustotheca clavata TaxID=74557 RepID=A0A1W0AAP7_9STRA|nr:cohesin subunit [Thraustotheca clavata]